MPYKDWTKERRAGYMRRYRASHKEDSLKGGRFTRSLRKGVNLDLVPLSHMTPSQRRQAARRATIETMGFTNEAYVWHLEERIRSLEESRIAMSWVIAELQAEAIMYNGTELEETERAI